MNKQKKVKFIIGLILISFILVLFFTGLIKTPYDPLFMDASCKMSNPSFKHIMGTDQFGRDIFSRILIGIRETMLVSVTVVLIGVFFGTIIGTIAGYYGGWFDEVVMRVNDAILAFPSILLALLVVSLMEGGTRSLIIALGIAFIPSFARMVRGEVLKIRNLDYINCVKLYGASDLRIIVVHILPNLKKVLLTTTLIGFNNAVLAEASMSYLGMGAAPPNPSLGKMLSEAQTFIFNKPMMAIFPGLIIVIMILGFSLLSENV